MKKNLIRFAIILVLLATLTILNIFLIRGRHSWIVFGELKSNEISAIKIDHPELVDITRITYNKKDDYTRIDLKAKKSGDVTLTVELKNADKPVCSNTFNISRLLLVYENGFIGAIDHIDIIRIEIPILVAIMLINIIAMIWKTVRETMYSYRFMYYVGIAVFLGLNLFIWLLGLFITRRYWQSQLFSLYSEIIGVFTTFSVLVFPLIFILAIYLIISNISLIRHEGRSITNMLGILLGVFLVAMTATGYHTYDILDNVFDVHSYEGMHVTSFIEYSIYAVLTYLECLMTGTYICTKVAQNHIPTFNKDYIIILGCAMLKDGTATPLLKGRADRAISFAGQQKEKTGKDIYYVASGGKGDDEIISEAQSIKNYLLSRGIPEDRILLEDKSTNTRENMKFSYEVIQRFEAEHGISTVPNESADKDAPTNLAFSTTNYHVFRSGHIAYSQGIRVSGVGAPTKWYFYSNALIREFIANLNAEKKKHIKNIILMILFIAVMLTVSYVFGIM